MACIIRRKVAVTRWVVWTDNLHTWSTFINLSELLCTNRRIRASTWLASLGSPYFFSFFGRVCLTSWWNGLINHRGCCYLPCREIGCSGPGSTNNDTWIALFTLYCFMIDVDSMSSILRFFLVWKPEDILRYLSNGYSGVATLQLSLIWRPSVFYRRCVTGLDSEIYTQICTQ